MVLCTVRRPITTLDCVLLKGTCLVFALGLGPKISLWVCLWVLRRPCHLAKCWLENQHFICLLIFCLVTPKDSCGPRHFWTEQFLASLSVILFPHTQHVREPCPAPQYCVWRYHSMPFGTVIRMEMFWWPERLSEPRGCQCKYSHTSLVYHAIEFYNHRPSYIWASKNFAYLSREILSLLPTDFP